MHQFWDMCHEWALYKGFRHKKALLKQKGFEKFMNSLRRLPVPLILSPHEGYHLQLIQ